MGSPFGIGGSDANAVNTTSNTTTGGANSPGLSGEAVLGGSGATVGKKGKLIVTQTNPDPTPLFSASLGALSDLAGKALTGAQQTITGATAALATTANTQQQTAADTATGGASSAGKTLITIAGIIGAVLILPKLFKHLDPRK